MKITLPFIMVGSLLLKGEVTAQSAEPKANSNAKRPNIVIIVADDMGYSDMGMFGSEIKTPNLDALAMEGVRFTNFYTCASCSPSRSMLLSGVDTHLNGMGNMDEWTAPNQVGLDGYEGELNEKVVTLPQLLKDAGYHTYMVGKWHLGKSPDHIPAARGFERDFSMLDGMGSYWDMTNMAALVPNTLFTEDGKYLTKLPKNYYATTTYTEKMISFIDDNHGDGKPFFAYFASQAPHDPYGLPKDWRDRHVGQYDFGWDLTRQQRLKKQKELGIVSESTELAERMWFVPDYSVLAAGPRALLGRKMELYAGLVENLDYHIGLLIDHLKEIGEYDNTIFIIFGDNGAEGNDLGAMIAGQPGSLNSLFFAKEWSNNSPQAWGEPGSYVGYGPGWAQVSMTPFSQYKGWLAEGGVHNALVVSGPVNKRAKGSINNGLMSIADIMPTLLEVAGAEYPETYNGNELPPLIGKSWTRVLAGEAGTPRTPEDYLAWELFGNRALRQGDWKLRWEFAPLGKSEWELFNLAEDPAERNDLASANPDKVKEMLLLWEDYVKSNNVILPSRSPFENLIDVLPMRFPVEAGYPPMIHKKQYTPPQDMMAEPKK
ncbi:MAG: arylsulfatase [Bacteroidales bacterium]|nr:arylsulfatase [Bacteroidales bacterium]